MHMFSQNQISCLSHLCETYFGVRTSTAWSPHVKLDIAMLENVQRKAAAAHFVYYNFSTYSSVTSMLTQLLTKHLKKEKQIPLAIIMFYKVISNLISIDDLQPVMSSTCGYHERHIQQYATFIICNYVTAKKNGAKEWSGCFVQQTLRGVVFRYDSIYVLQ